MFQEKFKFEYRLLFSKTRCLKRLARQPSGYPSDASRESKRTRLSYRLYQLKLESMYLFVLVKRFGRTFKFVDASICITKHPSTLNNLNSSYAYGCLTCTPKLKLDSNIVANNLLYYTVTCDLIQGVQRVLSLWSIS